MAKPQKLVRLTQEALDELEALSANDTHKYNESSVIEALIHEAYGRRADHLKRVEARREGKKIVGWDYSYGDHHVGYADGAASRPQAEKALDAFVYEELSK